MLKSTMCCVAQPRSEKTKLENGHKSMKTEARIGAIENHNNHIVAHPKNKENKKITNVVR